MWKDILGQESAINILKKTIKQNRLGSSYLFSGPDGVGKTKTAKELAKVCNCQNVQQEDSCGVCSSCYKIEQDIHPDVKVIKPASIHFLISQIQNLQKEVYTTPFEGKKKVYILDEIDKMTKEAANAFLKTLEEPTSNTMFILITSGLETLLPTITSRCRPVRFNLIPEGIQTQIFSKWGLEPSKFHLLAQASGGSLGRAKEYLEKGIFEHQDKLSASLENIFNEASLKSDEGFLLISKIATQIVDYYKKENIELFLEIFSVWLKQSVKLVSLNFINLYKAIDIVIETQKIIRFQNANLQLAMEVMFIKLKECRN
ncbi:MAG: DNA polymerase III subunit delta' [Nitrospirota bacterium]